jgi:hypothetical protein
VTIDPTSARQGTVIDLVIVIFAFITPSKALVTATLH